MSEHKKQHILPRFYLEGFSSEETINGNKQNILWYYDIENKIIKCKSVDNISFKPYYYSYKTKNNKYDHSVEIYFSKLESYTSRIIKKIENDIDFLIKNYYKKNCAINRGLTEEDKQVLLIFIFYMLKRVPAFLDRIESKWREKYIELLKYFKREFDEAEFKEYLIRTMMLIGTGENVNFVEFFGKKNIEFMCNSYDDSTIITTDNPLHLINYNGPNGLINEGTNIRFPLSKKIMLNLYDIGNTKKIGKIISKRKLLDINIDIALRSYKFIYCCNEIYLKKILKLIKKIDNRF